MRESMTRDGGVGEMRSMMISRVSVSMGRRLSLEVTMIEGGIAILVGIEVVRGVEVDQESTDEGDHAEDLERQNPNNTIFSYDSQRPYKIDVTT